MCFIGNQTTNYLGGYDYVDSDDDPDYGIAVDYDVKLGIFGR